MIMLLLIRITHILYMHHKSDYVLPLLFKDTHPPIMTSTILFFFFLLAGYVRPSACPFLYVPTGQGSPLEYLN